MVMLRISTLLVAYALIVCQMSISNASPARPPLESSPDRTALTDYEARRLLQAIVKEFMQMNAEDVEQQAAEESSFSACGLSPHSLGRAVSKRCSSLSTCVLGKLSQELHKLQTYPRTNVGAGTPGKKRSLEENAELAGFGEALDRI
ncbi:hypothetical protein DNTS_014345 [Danionella cerebrum]|uniref:Calcitonin peptide-like domain-containing protein n=1 Tax=Danionella cerebrum TaxID=2873325 RepID=A0A553NME1_9TELE|nr:hypothetical protein DNTS_014345 [Danionella translucida]